MEFEVAKLTDRGQRRRENEDSVLVRHLSPTSRYGQSAYLLAVADGMGGAVGGATASAETVQALDSASKGFTGDDPPTELRGAIALAHSSVRSVAEEHPELLGMATTLVLAIVGESRAWLANVGDSRAYLIRNGQAQRMSQDHSWVGEQVRAGVMTEEEAASHPRRNIITRSISSTDSYLEPDIYAPIDLQDGDILLLCSDGLYGVVADQEIASIAANLPAEDAVAELVSLANQRGGPDNISVIIARTAGGRSGRTLAFTRPGIATGHSRRAFLLAAIAGFAVVGVVVLLILGNRSNEGDTKQPNAGSLASSDASASASEATADVTAPAAILTSPVPTASPVVKVESCSAPIGSIETRSCLRIRQESYSTLDSLAPWLIGYITKLGSIPGLSETALASYQGLIGGADKSIIEQIVYFYNPDIYYANSSCGINDLSSFLFPITSNTAGSGTSLMELLPADSKEEARWKSWSECSPAPSPTASGAPSSTKVPSTKVPTATVLFPTPTPTHTAVPSPQSSSSAPIVTPTPRSVRREGQPSAIP